MFAIVVLVLICVPLLWWYSVLKKYKTLDVVPGPRPLPILGNAIDLGNTPQNFFVNMTRWRQQYGKIYKFYVANDLRVVISEPKIIEQIMNSNTHITKSNAYDLLGPWLGSGLLTSTGQQWKIHRKMITPTFHFKILEQFIELFNSCSNILVDRLSHEVGKTSIDIYPFINLYALDVICETSMGVKVSVQEGENTEYVKAVHGFLDIFMRRVFSAWKRFDLLFKLSTMHETFYQYLKTLHTFSNTVIQRRREEKCQERPEPEYTEDGIKRKVALLDMLLESEDNAKLTNEDLRQQIDTIMFAGHDTTTSALAFTVLLLAEHQEAQEKLYDEILSTVGSEERNPNFTLQNLQEMKYLEMVIKESLRIYPSVPIVERRLEKDFVINEYTFPKDAFLSLFIYVMHHDEEYFPEPEKFNPDRFLVESPRQNYTYVPFSAGPRNCIGQKFAMLLMKTTIAKIVSNFRITPVPTFKPDLGMAAVLKSYNGVCVRLQPRNETSE